MSFSDLGLIPELCSVCQRVKWLYPTQIQSAAIPVALEGKDIVGIAETGSGKTGAFLLPIIQHWIKSGQPVGFALILAPTRELAQQLANEAEHLGQYKSDEMEFRLQVIRLVGGEDIVDQALKLAWRKHHIIVATPGRLVDHLKQSPNFAAHQLSTIRHFVLDEADRMLNMSFAEDIDKILNLYEKPKSQSRKRKKKSKTILEKISESNERHNGNTSTNNFKASINPIKSKYPHPQTYLYSATMTKDVVKLRRAALSSNAVFISSNDPLQKAEEQGGVEKGNSTEKINPTDQLQSFTAGPAAANSIDTVIKCLKTGFPAGLSHYCLPIRLTDRAAMLDWIVESVTRTNVLEKLGVSADNSNTSSQQNHRIMIFCKRCHETVLVSEFLHERGHSTVALTGRMKQTERKESLSKFISGEVQILVATDVASRGLDIPHVEFVINYNVPLSEKTYRHRVGRTARAGQRGIALTLVTRDVAPVFLELEASLLPYLPKSKAEVSDPSPGIPRWPIPVPHLNGRDSILVRRRLADQAWSRASKTIRAQIASQKPVDNDDLPNLDLPMDEDILQEYADSDNSDDAESDDDDDDSDNNEEHSSPSSSSDSDSGNDSSAVEKQSSKRKLPKPPASFKLKTSGEAGIAAARKTWKCIAKLNQQQKKEQAELEETHRVSKSIGWGVTFTNKDDDDETVDDNHNMHNDEMSDDEDDNEAVRYEQPIKTKYAKIQASKKAKKNKQNKKFYA